MKKICSLALVALMAGIMLCSCQKTKEEQFISSMKDFYKINEKGYEKDYVLEEKAKAIEDEFGEDATGALSYDEKLSKKDIERWDLDLDLTSEQIKELNEIRKEYKKHRKELEKKAEKLEKKLK